MLFVVLEKSHASLLLLSFDPMTVDPEGGGVDLLPERPLLVGRIGGLDGRYGRTAISTRRLLKAVNETDRLSSRHETPGGGKGERGG